MEWISKSPKETIRLGEKLMEEFPEHRLICLKGELGSGKTCLMKGIGRALNVSENMIKSPTFTTVFTYQVGEIENQGEREKVERAEEQISAGLVGPEKFETELSETFLMRTTARRGSRKGNQPFPFRSIHHCDFYRCEKLEDFPVDWWRDLLDQNTLVVVEWSDRIQPHLPVPRLEVQFIITDKNERKLIINEITHEKK